MHFAILFKTERVEKEAVPWPRNYYYFLYKPPGIFRTTQYINESLDTINKYCQLQYIEPMM